MKYIAISFLFLLAESFAQNISGNVQDFLFNVPLEEVGVILKNNTDGSVLGTDSTDVSGSYSIDYVIVNVDDNKSLPTGYYLSNPYPQPFNPSARFDFNTPQQGTYDIKIYNIIGQVLYDKSFTIETGRHNFIVSGLGSAGVYLFNITSKNFTTTKKLVLLDGGSNNINVELTAGRNSDLKKINYGDLKVEFRKAGYVNKDTAIAWQMNLQVGAKIKQIGSSGSIQFNGLLTKLPTNTPGQSVTVTLRDNSTNAVICSTLSAINGFYTCNVNYNSYTNPNNASEIIYSPSAIKVTLIGTNYISRDTIIAFTGSNLSWLTTIQQSLINRTADVHGQVIDSLTLAGIPSAQIKVYKNSDGSLLSSGSTNNGGYYSTNFNFLGYDDDDEGLYNNIGDLRVEASKNGYDLKDTVTSFALSSEVNLILPPESYQVNATIKLYNTKGDVITDLDSLKFIWPDGSVEMIPNNNGTVTINKTLYTLNSDTTAVVTHNHPELYLKWIIGTTNDSNKVERLYQNPGPGPETDALIPLHLIHNKTSELYLIPRYTTYGVNNNIQMDMDSETINTFFNQGGGGRTGCFIPSPSGYDTTDVILKLYSEFTGQPVDSTWIIIAKTEVLTFLSATQWPNKKLLNYRFTEIASDDDPFFLYLTNSSGRNRDNLSVTTYGQFDVNHKEYEGIFGGTVRIYASNSWYSYPGVGVITEEFYCSMICIEFDGAENVRKSDGTYNDLGKHLIGINHLMKPGTYWRTWK